MATSEGRRARQALNIEAAHLNGARLIMPYRFSPVKRVSAQRQGPSHRTTTDLDEFLRPIFLPPLLSLLRNSYLQSSDHHSSIQLIKHYESSTRILSYLESLEQSQVPHRDWSDSGNRQAVTIIGS
ncbi:hypothetical protein K0M31_002840 [Melipona bicolor]|uniref:Uncharacterized protein n=1 Tax=Melipona bicolor TaxID=60889 RepID=A0AA40FZR3_9HYME|nr:hypothetical protein K0M31_002840 [Melipona bicolor]